MKISSLLQSSVVKESSSRDISVGLEEAIAFASGHGYDLSTSAIKVFGKTQYASIFTKEEHLDGTDITLQYVVNRKTDSWIFQAKPTATDINSMTVFHTGEDISTLMKHLSKKRKLTSHEVASYLAPRYPVIPSEK